MKKFKTLLLDVDGTLLDFNKSQEMALQKAFANHQIPLTAAVRARYNTINHGLWKQYELGEIDRDTVIYTRFGKLFSELSVDCDGVAFEDEYQRLLGEGAYELPGARELLLYLKERYDLYIVTNGVAETQRSRLSATGYDQYVKDIFISGEMGCQKPMKEYFDLCFARIPHFEKDTSMIIGDSLSSDIKGGNNAGITACWYNPDKQNNDGTAAPDLEVHDYSELYEIL